VRAEVTLLERAGVRQGLDPVPTSSSRSFPIPRMLHQLPPEIIQKIVIHACPLISLSLARSESTTNKAERKKGHTTRPKNDKTVTPASLGGKESQTNGTKSHGGTDAARYFEISPPTVISNVAQTCSAINGALEYKNNAWLYAQVFERTFDFGAARRRLGEVWASAHGLAWEGRRRWEMARRIKRAVAIWEKGWSLLLERELLWLSVLLADILIPFVKSIGHL
jgi:hypothetical protein